LPLLTSCLLDFDPGLRARFDRMVEVRAGDVVRTCFDKTGADKRLTFDLCQCHFDPVLVDDSEWDIHEVLPLALGQFSDQEMSSREMIT